MIKHWLVAILIAAIAICLGMGFNQLRKNAAQRELRNLLSIGAVVDTSNGRIVGISFDKTKAARKAAREDRYPFSDRHLAIITRLNSLKSLDVNRTAIADQDVSQLTQMTSIQMLDISFTQCTDTGIAAVIRTSSVQTLVVDSKQIGDRFFRALEESPALQVLMIEGEISADDNARISAVDVPRLQVYIVNKVRH